MVRKASSTPSTLMIMCRATICCAGSIISLTLATCGSTWHRSIPWSGSRLDEHSYGVHQGQYLNSRSQSFRSYRYELQEHRRTPRHRRTRASALGSHVMVAWDGSREATRAVHDAL